MPATRLEGRRIQKKSSVRKITQWKQRIIEAIAMDDEIAKLLWYNTPDALSRPALTEDQKYELADSSSDHRRIYPTRYTPNVVMDQKSFIGLGISGFVPQESYQSFSQRYTMGYLYFYILVDNKIMDIDEGQRQDEILARVYDIFQDEKGFGFGTVQEGDLTEAWDQNNKFGGYVLMMRVVDLK